MKQMLLKHANTAAERFLKEKVSLNDTITEIAKENNLNIEQVKRLCEMANQSVQMSLYPVDPIVQFDVANSKEVVANLNTASEVVPAQDTIPTLPQTEPNLLTDYMKQYGPEKTEKKPVKITIIMIKRIEKAVNNEDQKLSYEKYKLGKEAEQLDLELRHMVKLAMQDGSYSFLIKAGWDTLEKDGMKYVLEKMAFWKKNGIFWHNPLPVSGILNKEHSFVTNLVKLSQAKKRLKDIGVAQKKLESVAKKLIEISKESPQTIKKQDILKKPTQILYKGS